MDEIHTGSCNCGAIRFRTRGPLRGVIYCHCSQCRRQTGHYYAATNVPDANVVIEGGDNLTWFESSGFARRGFCRICGSAMFWKPLEHPYVSVLAGVFDEPAGLSGLCHIFMADKAGYYEVNDGLPQFAASTPDIAVAPD